MLQEDTVQIPRHDGSKTLVLLLHGLRRGPYFLEDLEKATKEVWQDAECRAPQMPLSVSSTAAATNVAEWLAEQVEQEIAKRKKLGGPAFDNIILVGHSFGAVLARAMWVYAHGAQPDGSIDVEKRKPWAPNISRIVMLAAVARGYTNQSPATFRRRLEFWLGDIIDMFNLKLIAFSLRRGAPFLTCLRLQCLAVHKSLHGTPYAPTVVQLLGTKDDFVAPTDNLDLATSRDFHFLEVPKSGHLDIPDFRNPPDVGQRRKMHYMLAVGAPAQTLRKHALPTRDVYQIFEESEDSFDTASETESERLRKKYEAVKRVVFIVHGIRDYGYWTRKMAAHIRREAREKNISCRCVTSSYGYFPMGPFLVPSIRRRRAEWLMDQYVQAKALYPNAEFSFIGHSNGTYLLAHSLSKCKAIKFDTVIFAGSVVSTKFDWNGLIASGQVNRMTNYIATNDWVVASFPRVLQMIPWFDLGSAGHDGFKNRHPRVMAPAYVPGEHSAALQEDFWQEMAGYVLGGAEPLDLQARAGSGPTVPKLETKQRAKAKLAWLLVPGAILALLALTWMPLMALGFPGPFSHWFAHFNAAPYVWALVLLLSAWLISRVLTRL